MKAKKINLNWQGILLGVALCLVLVFFVASKAANPQVDGTVKPRVMQRAANLNDVWEQTAVLEAKIIAMDERLVRIEKKIDAIGNEVNRTLQNSRKILKEETKN
ncbi:MAG: hypothetical protein E4H23_11110 [Chrysiogenales bacterium]|nr:MAG: hypothetical protein E4H23_11110 [Chrysiogenales bacterium]